MTREEVKALLERAVAPLALAELERIGERVYPRVIRAASYPPMEVTWPEIAEAEALVTVPEIPLAEGELWTPAPRGLFPWDTEFVTAEGRAWTNVTAATPPSAPSPWDPTLAAELRDELRGRIETLERGLWADTLRHGRLFGADPAPGGNCSTSFRVMAANDCWTTPYPYVCPGPPIPACLQEYAEAVALRNEWLAWRLVPRVDPAAGPEAHPLDPTCGQVLRFYSWHVLLMEREDMAGMADPDLPTTPAAA